MAALAQLAAGLPAAGDDRWAGVDGAGRSLAVEVLPPAVAEPMRLPPQDFTNLWRRGAGAVPALAEGHGVAALLEPLLADALPSGPAAELADAARRTLARGVQLAADWQRVQAGLCGAGVAHTPLKWAALAPLLYEPAALRPAADVDLLVPPESVEAATAVLRRVGYDLVSQTWKHQVFLRPDNRAVVDPRGEHPQNPRPVEVHTWLGEGFRGIRLDLTAHAAATPAGSGLPLALALTHLAAHTTVDALGRRLRLIQLVDLARLSARLAGDEWHEVLQFGCSRHGARFVWPALALAQRHVSAPVPEPILGTLAACVAPRLARWVMAADLDGLSWFGRADTRRALGEVPAIWPLDARELWAVWRFILAPRRGELADRYPWHAGSHAWPLLYLRHGAFNVQRLFARWRLRR